MNGGSKSDNKSLLAAQVSWRKEKQVLNTNKDTLHTKENINCHYKCVFSNSRVTFGLAGVEDCAKPPSLYSF